MGRSIDSTKSGYLAEFRVCEPYHTPVCSAGELWFLSKGRMIEIGGKQVGRGNRLIVGRQQENQVLTGELVGKVPGIQWRDEWEEAGGGTGYLEGGCQWGLYLVNYFEGGGCRRCQSAAFFSEKPLVQAQP